MTTSDSLLIQRMYDYRRNFAADVCDSTRNIYVKYDVDVQKRNLSLALVPSLYNISKGMRMYVGEMYGSIRFKDVKHYDIQKELQLTTVPHSSNILPTMTQYLVPDIYAIDLIEGNLLSPFNRQNKLYYFMRVSPVSHRYSIVTYIPRARSTQLVKGFALVDNMTGRIVNAKIVGEYDMMEFSLDLEMGDITKNNSIIPVRSTARTLFKFMGNRISTTFTAVFNCKGSIPDSITDKRKAMAYLRPVELSAKQRGLYDNFYGNTDSISTTKRKESPWDLIGNHMFNSHSTGTDKASVRLSPLINPLYMSYSGRRGLSYHLRLGSTLKFSESKYLSFSPRFGYNFKIKQFFFRTPLRYTFSEKHNGWIESDVANGNRISNYQLPDYFNDFNTRLSLNYRIGKVELTPSLMYHRRTAMNKEAVEAEGKETRYDSFAPSLKLSYTHSPDWPTLSVNYERGLKKVMKSNMEYEKWEFDASYKKRMQSLRILSLRTGYGFYSNRRVNYFIDYANFHENYLPDGWDDEWSGEFQLVNSEWYNTSRFYYRANASFESPLMFLTFIPKLGKYLESERAYAGFLLLDNTRPYTELGYGFKSRYFSLGVFGSFLKLNFQEIGCKFTLELFRKW
ncbi:MAG: DUF5686 family protein [Prevotella sp.]